ncbi:MAG: T9SS type A sorting domain-containing protein [Chitinophagales bacterium]|nr:T9SS type A sorting domain-containing protein [Chitinophagales bacterium]
MGCPRHLYLGNTITGPGSLNPDILTRGIGISSSDADYILEPYCDPSQSPCTPVVNQFTNLYRGVYALVSDGTQLTHTLTLDQNNFSGTYRGIYMSAYTNNPVITSNTFNLDLLPSGQIYGLYMSACTGYTVQENDFTGPANGPPLLANSYGIIVNNSGQYANLIYRNDFTGLQYGAASMGENAGNIVNYITNGLVFKCNDFITSKYNIAVFSPSSPAIIGSIQRSQGSCSGSNGPAGNRFYDSAPVIWQLYHDGLSSAAITYYHHSNGAYVPVASKVKSPWVLNNCNIHSDGNTCPKLITKGNGFGYRSAISPSEEMIAAINAYEHQEDSLNAMIDGGNTQKLVSEVNDPKVSSSKLTKDLLAASPYLSDSVLMSSILRNPPMNDNELQQLVLSNSPLDDTTFSLLKTTNAKLADNGAIKDAQEAEASAMDLLQAQIGDLFTWRNYELYQLVNYYVANNESDSAREFLLSKNENTMALPFVFQNGDFKTADNIIASMPETNSDEKNLKDYYSIMLTRAESGNSMDSLTDDQWNEVQKMANKNSIAGYLALNLLDHVKGETYEEDFPPIIEEGTDTAMQRTSKGYSQEKITVDLIPNPAQNQVIITIGNMGTSESIWMEIFDVMGNKFAAIPFGAAQLSYTVNTSMYPPGIYLLNFKSDNQIVTQKKLIVLKK